MPTHKFNDLKMVTTESPKDPEGYFKSAISKIQEKNLRTGLKVVLFITMSEIMVGGCKHLYKLMFSENKIETQQQITTAPNQQLPVSKP